MLTMDQKNEYDVLKAQMQVLKSHLANDEIVSKEMLEAAVKSSARNLADRRFMNILAIAADLLVVAFIAYVCLSLHKCSVLFMIATTVWGIFLAALSYLRYKNDIRSQLLDGSLVDTVRTVTAWKRQNMTQGLLTAVASVIWACFCLNEIWDDVTGNLEHAVFAAVIFLFVLGVTCSRYLSVNKVTTNLLKQIKELR